MATLPPSSSTPTPAPAGAPDRDPVADPEAVIEPVVTDSAAVPPTFDQLYRDEYDGLVRAAYLLTGDESIAEEVVQDAFVATHLRWARLRTPGGFLRTCVVNGCRDRLRRQGRLRVIIPKLAPHPFADDGGPGHEAAELFDVLATLPLRQRAAVVGRYYCGWDDQDLAGALGVRPATVRSLVHRGLAALRIELTP